jgi:Na+/proline symporter
MGMLQLTTYIGLLLKTSGAMITAVTAGAINADKAILATVVVFVIYGFAGGLSAAIFTNLVQGIMTLILSFMLLPFALPKVGGIAGLWNLLPDKNMLKVIAPTEITAFYIAVISINGLIGWVTQPNAMAMTSAGKTEMEGRVGVMCGIMTKRVCTIAWAIVGLCGAGMYLGKTIDGDQIYGLVAHDLLPNVAPGFLGLFIASMLAAVMSCCGSLMITSSALFTKNLYKPLLAPGHTDRHYMWVGRVVAALVVFVGVCFAYGFESLIHGLEVAWRIQPTMGIAFFMGLLWRRANPKAAWTATLLTFTTMLFTSDLTMFGIPWNFNAHFADKLPAFMLFNGKLYLPWQMIAYLAVGFVSFIIVALLTSPTAKEKLDKFYECIRTPITPNEPEAEPFTLPPGLTPAPRDVLIKHPDWEIPKPSKVSIIGFLVGWVAVGILIWSFFWIMKP